MEGIHTFFYSIKQGIINLKRNKMFTITSICTITACLFLFGLCYSLVSNIQYIVKSIEGNVAITVFFDEGTKDSQKAEIALELKENKKIKKVEYISAEQAWENFKEDIFETQPELVDTFEEDNPLADSDSYLVYVKDMSEQNSVVKTIEKMDGVRKVKSSKEAVKTLVTFNRVIGIVSVVLIIILLTVSTFLIQNTIIVGISVRREEIRIMRMIGATDFFVQGPFVVEGITIGLIGALIPILVLLITYNRVLNWISSQFGVLTNWISFLSLQSEFMVIVPACIGLGVGIGLVGSLVTVKKHLNV
ncbi:MAG: permease-like cell division protein FtsX [Lachnospiraceae bacterium]|nr:permease-like cell division protein FtsX [Lachnospiraceae bacterium]